MRKISIKDILFNRRTSANRERRNNRRKGKKLNTLKLSNPSIHSCPIIAKVMGRKVVKAPEHLSMHHKNLNSFVEFIVRLRKESGKNDLLIDFSNTVYISASAATYFYSELSLIFAKLDQSRVRFYLPSIAPQTKRGLVDFGVMLLVHGSPKPVYERMMPVVNGVDDNRSEDIAKFLVAQARLNGVISEDPKEIAQTEHISHRAIQEAMLNVKYHAYQTNVKRKSWWVTSAIVKDILYIALVDRGVGMPQTLPKAGFWENAIGLLPINDDGQMILAAMAYTRSSSRRANSKSGRIGRGLGTRDMQNLVLGRRAGFLTIVSGKGFYRLDGRTGEEIVRTSKFDVSGTVVQWALPLK